MCIKVCRNHAKKAITYPLDIIKNFKFKVALPAPTLYAQFKHITNVNLILTGLKKLGFDDVFEVSYAAQLVSAETRKYLAEHNVKKPVISSACPAAIRLICMNFPALIENILPIASPMEISARLAKKHFSEKTGLPEKEIGVFFLTPCPAKATNAEHPLGIEKSAVDSVISISDIFLPLRAAIGEIKEPEMLLQSSPQGMDWALSGGETKGIELENSLAVDGLENLLVILEEIENGQCNDVDFVELLSCTGGCVGGPLTLVNGFVAKNFLKRAERDSETIPEEQKRRLDAKLDRSEFCFTKTVEATEKTRLGSDMADAINKMEEMERIINLLPGIDCGSCGAPTCKTFAEDIVRGTATLEECEFVLRKKVFELAEMMVDLSAKIPQTLRNHNY